MVRVSKETRSSAGSVLPPPPCKGKMTCTALVLPFGWLLKAILGMICLPPVTRRITLLTPVHAPANIHARCNTTALVPAGTRARKVRPVMVLILRSTDVMREPAVNPAAISKVQTYCANSKSVSAMTVAGTEESAWSTIRRCNVEYWRRHWNVHPRSSK